MEGYNRYLNKAYKKVNGIGRNTRVEVLKDSDVEYKQEDPEFLNKDRWFESLVGNHKNIAL